MNPPNSITTFTEKEFFEEIHRFRQHLGDKTFWAKTPEQRQAMIDGLSFMYLNVMNDDGSFPSREKIDQWGNIFNQTLSEYTRRDSMTLMLALKKLSQ